MDNSSKPTEREVCAAIAASGRFDASYYLTRNPDVAESGMDPVLHYVRYGEKEGRRPSRTFALEMHSRHYNDTGNILFQHIIEDAAAAHAGIDVPVVFALNETFIPYFSVALASLIVNSSPNNLYRIHVIHNGVNSAKFDKLRTLERENIRIIPMCVHDHVERTVAKAFTSRHLSLETYFKILVPSIFESTDKILYLDSDIIVLRDLAGLFLEDLGQSSLGAVREKILDNLYYRRLAAQLPEGCIDSYCNAGVILFNTARFLSSGCFDVCRELEHFAFNFLQYSHKI